MAIDIKGLNLFTQNDSMLSNHLVPADASLWATLLLLHVLLDVVPLATLPLLLYALLYGVFMRA